MHGTLGAAAVADADSCSQQRRGLPRWLLPVLLIAAVLGGAYVMLKRGAPKTGAARSPAAAAAAASVANRPRVTVTVPRVQTVEATVRATGSIAARRTSPIGATGEGGLVLAVLAKEGDFVRRGQTLVRVDHSVQEQQLQQWAASIRQAEADARLAQAELDRAMQLVSRGFISKADIDRRTAARDGADARVAVAKAQLAEGRARLARLDIRAPEDGLILTRAVEPGQVIAGGGQALFTMAQGGAMEMRAAVAEQDLAAVAVGSIADVQPVGAAAPVRGRVWLKDPIIDPSSRQGIARIALPASRELRPGAFARATISGGTAQRPVLPQSSVLSDPKGSYVMVVDAANRVERRPVTVGQVTADGLVIESGLSGTERVVMSAGAFLNQGETVVPVSPSAR
ncbi:MAG: efflux RND transporter periplasmic adaptor subunit [Sphingomonadaceae bacterium]|nr:efflux RND transporter periplasmic adaptor subunit [Sphingomonadaceae bacterium]